jgi:WD40 repeat protein
VTLRVKATAPNLPPQDLTVAVRVVGLRELKVLGTDLGQLTCVTIARTGQLALTGGGDGTVRLWDLKAGREVWAKPLHKAAVRSVAFSPDGQQALAGSDDRTISWWEEVTAPALPKKLDNGEHKTGVWKVFFLPRAGKVDAPDGKTSVPVYALTPVSLSSNATVFWNPRTGTPYRYGGRKESFIVVGAKSLTGGGKEPAADVRLAAEADDYDLAGLTGDTLEVYRGTDRVARLAGHGTIKAMTLSADGKRALVLSADGRLRLWDVPNEKLLPGSPWSPPAAVTAVALTPDGTQALFGTADGSLRLWKLPQ